MIYLVSKTLFKLDTCTLLQYLIRGGFSQYAFMPDRFPNKIQIHKY